MDKYCVNDRNKLLDKINMNKNSLSQKIKHSTATSNIKECFTEYSLEDKVEALKNMLSYNEKHGQIGPSYTNKICNLKKTTGIKECLQGNEETPFQTLISELRNTVMNSYWNKEIGKTRYQVPNLPIGLNPLDTTFGKKIKSEATVAELLKEKVDKNNILEQDILEMYKKSHNSYLPAEQIKRRYKKPFDQNLYFGKPTNTSTEGARVKKLLTWVITDVNKIINSELDDFIEDSRSDIKEVRNLKNTHICTNVVSSKINEKKGENIQSILNECSPNNDQKIMQYNYLEYINSLRQRLKKRVPEIPFADVFEDLVNLDKDYTEILPENEVFPVLAKYKIYVNEILLMPLLDLLQIRKGKNVKYTALLNLLNWKYDFPTLPKIEKTPIECQNYSTTYNETIGNIEEKSIINVSAAGIPSNITGEKTTAFNLIFPNIFTRYGLSNLDLSKVRSKEEMKSIFERIGIQFPNDNFDLVWEEEFKKSGNGNLSIETFRHLFDQYNY
ncbi:EF-hand domain-containing family member B isoform X2 [Megachile rotundata]|uniref:EF-hand domain-containing family member B isoform X2 n=1 Tax=Megachile rotundata TaxID=143995 RepID=UPI003FD5C48B